MGRRPPAGRAGGAVDRRLALDTANPVFAAGCHVPPKQRDQARGVRLYVATDGELTLVKPCSFSDTPLSGGDFAVDPNPGWLREKDLEAGDRFSVTAWLQREGERTEVPGALFGVAFYAP